MPSRTVFCDALKRDRSQAERAYTRHGEDGRRRYSVYRRWEPSARNDVWETDHAELEINVLPLRGRRLARPWLTVIEDGFSRLVMGWALSLQPSSAEVPVAIRVGISIDPERGPWGGVPQLIRFDGGREFLAQAVTQYLRHLHDDPATRFPLLFDGRDGCWEVLAREPMLRSRIYRRVAFRPLSDTDMLALLPGYHPIYADVDPELLVLINDKAANGRLRSWAAFTHTAIGICRGIGAERIDTAVARNAISQLGNAR